MGYQVRFFFRHFQWMQSANLSIRLVALCGLEGSDSAAAGVHMAFGPPEVFLYHKDSKGGLNIQ